MAKLDKQWRYSSIEKRVFHAAMAGGFIDFTKEEGFDEANPPSISGRFLSQLWSGALTPPGEAVRRISLVGLRIEGQVSLVGVRQVRGAGENVASLFASDCEFDGVLFLDDAPMADLRFTRCRFQSEAKVGSIFLAGSRLRGSLVMRHCSVAHTITFANSNIGRAVVIDSTTIGSEECPAELIGEGASIGGNFTLNNSRIFGPVRLAGSKCDRFLAISGIECGCVRAPGATISGELLMDRSTMRGEQVSLDFRNLTAGNVQLVKMALDGMADMSAIACNDLIAMQMQIGVGGQWEAWLGLANARIARSLRIMKSHLSGGLAGHGLTVGSDTLLKKLVVRSTANRIAIIDLSGMKCADRVSLLDLQCPGATISLVRAEIAEQLTVARIKAERLNCQGFSALWGTISHASLERELLLQTGTVQGFLKIRHTRVAPPVEVLNEQGPAGEKECRIQADGFSCGDDLSVYASFVWGCVRGRNIRVGKNLDVWQLLVAGPCTRASIDLQNATVSDIAAFRRCHFQHGATLTLLSATDLLVDSSRFGRASAADGDDRPISFSASNLQISRHLKFLSTLGRQSRNHVNVFEGPVLLSNAVIGSTLRIGDGKFATYPTTEEPNRSSLWLERAEIGGDVIIGPTLSEKRRAGWGADVPSFEGSVTLDSARVSGWVVLRGCRLSAHFSDTDDAGLEDREEALSRFKDGVALSLRFARLEGVLELAEPAIAGTVDLRDAHIARLVDDGAAGWRSAGIGDGELLLEGLTYDDLDGLSEVRNERGLWGALKRSLGLSFPAEAEARLDWIAMQDAAGANQFAPQPFEQLAHYFAQDGDERSRRHVLVAKRERQRRFGGLGLFERGLTWLLKVTSNYGYSPARAMLWLVAYFAFGTMLAWQLGSAGAIQANSADLVSPYPYNYLVLAVDAAIPIIDLDHDSMLTIDPAALPWWASADGILVGKALYEIIGMLLLSITVLTLTGTLRDKE